MKSNSTTLSLAWSNVDVCSLTGIPLQTTDRVFVLGTTRAEPTTIGIVALDRVDGSLVVFEPLPDALDFQSSEPLDISTLADALFNGLGAIDSNVSAYDRLGVRDVPAYNNQLLRNNFYAAMQTDGDSLVFGIVGGVVRALPLT